MVKPPSLKVIQKNIALIRRVLSFFLHKKKGSMALEGAIVFPIFLFFMMTVLFSIEMVRFQSNVFEALHQAEMKKAVQGYFFRYSHQPEEDVTEDIRKYIDNQLQSFLYAIGGSTGIQIQDDSSIGINGEIYLQAEYHIKSWIAWIPMGRCQFRDRLMGHAFVGYSGKEEGGITGERECYVYVTRTGSRYHMSSNCTHLRIQVKSVSFSILPECRNQTGEKYYPCERCHPSAQGQVYITDDGNRYHGQSDCSSLKREVYVIPLGEAGAYSPCQKCAN